MAKAVKRPAESWIYIPKADRELDERERSVFTLAPMTYAQRAAVRDDMIRGVGARVFQSAGEIMLTHVVAIDNFPAGEPKPWPAKRDAREKYLELLNDDLILEVGNEVFARSDLGEDVATIKNSSPPEGTSLSGESSTTTTSSIAARPAQPIQS